MNSVFNKKIPFYFHIESLLRQKILTGQLAAAQKLPTEKELAAQFDVSPITIRTALANLEAEGLILRRRGKGTFVAMQVPLRKQVIVTGTVQSFVLDSERYKVKALGIEKKKIQETRIARDLEAFFQTGSQGQVCVVRRVRLLDRNPVSFIENFCHPEVAKHLTQKELSEQPLQRILQEKTGLDLGKSESYLESVPADPDVAEVLHSHVFAPMFLLQAYLWFRSGEPFEVVNIFMRPDFFKYKIDVGTAK
ncbi:MAG: GntR family transcriptional regulator [bacterium]